MKYISIFGSYNARSVGDKAILVGLINLLFEEARRSISIKVLCFDPEAINEDIKLFPWANKVQLIPIVPRNKIVIANNKSQQGRNDLPFRFKRRLPPIIRGEINQLISLVRFNRSMHKGIAEQTMGVIIGGGNLIMDLYPSWPIRPYLVSRKFRRAKLPVIIAGVGAFPINTFFGKILLKKTVRSANNVFVRDNITREFIYKNWRKNVSWHPDFALSYPLAHLNDVKHVGGPFICINVAPIFSENWVYRDKQKYEDYITNLVNGLYIYYHSTNRSIDLNFYDTNYPTDRSGTIEVIRRLREKGIPKSRIIYEDRLLSTLEIIEKLYGAKFALSTRLHAGLMAVRLGIPILSIAYQPKVKSVLSDIGLENCVIDINDMSNIHEKLIIIEKSPNSYQLNSNQIASLDRNNRQVIHKILNTLEIL